MTRYTRNSLMGKIKNDTKLEILFFEGEHLDGTLWKYWSIKVDGQYWIAGNEGNRLIVTDKEEYASHFASEKNAKEYVDFIKKFFVES